MEICVSKSDWIIKQDELHRVKANGQNLTDANGGCSAGWARRSLNILKRSFHHPMTLPHIDDDGDEEMEIDEDAVEKICNHVDMQLASGKDCDKITQARVETIKSNSKLEVCGSGSFSEPQLNSSGIVCIIEKGSEDTDVKMEEGISEQVVHCENELMIVDRVESVANTYDFSNAVVVNHTLKEQNDEGNSNRLSADSLVRDSPVQPPKEKEALSSSVSELPDEESLSKCPISDPLGGFSREISGEDMTDESGNGAVNCVSPACLSIVPTDGSPILKSPTPSVSPRINNSRKSLRTSSMLSVSQKDLKDDKKSDLEAVDMLSEKSMKSISYSAISTQTKRTSVATTEHLAASLHRGLEIIDNHHQNSGLRRSSFRFSLRPDFKPVLPVAKVDVGVQTSQNDDMPKEDPDLFLCNTCKNRMQLDVKEENESSNLQLVPFDGSQSADKSKKQVPKVSAIILAAFFALIQPS